MKWLKWTGIVVGGLVVIFLGVGMLLSSEFHVERSIVIDAPREQIHVLVGDLQRWPDWTPWQEGDPSIVTSDASSGVEYEMSFDGTFPSTGSLSYEADGDETRVTWTMDGELEGVFQRYFGLMLDSWVGADFEAGLEKLKATAEVLPPGPAEEASAASPEAG